MLRLVESTNDSAEQLRSLWLARVENRTGGLQGEVLSHPEDLCARIELARAVSVARRFEESTAEYLWLWQNMLEIDPSTHAVRATYLVSFIARLVRKYNA